MRCGGPGRGGVAMRVLEMERVRSGDQDGKWGDWRRGESRRGEDGDSWGGDSVDEETGDEETSICIVEEW